MNEAGRAKWLDEEIWGAPGIAARCVSPVHDQQAPMLPFFYAGPVHIAYSINVPSSY
jgi:hypothetical protein